MKLINILKEAMPGQQQATVGNQMNVLKTSLSPQTQQMIINDIQRALVNPNTQANMYIKNILNQLYNSFKQ